MIDKIKFVKSTDIDGAKGMIDSDGKISIAIDKHSSKEEIVETFMHEAIGHYGLRTMIESLKDTEVFTKAISALAPKALINPSDNA